MNDILGRKVKDKISGFVGIVNSWTEYLNGCVTVEVKSQTLTKDGLPAEAQWFDVVQVEVITGEHAETVRLASVPEAAPARTPTGGPPRSHPPDRG